MLGKKGMQYAEERDLTVLFSDIRNFTSFSRQMPPIDLFALLNDYYDRMKAIISMYGGTLDKFIGDAIMSYWGHPDVTEDHAARATLAALEMTAVVREMREDTVLPGGAILNIGVGINTGSMVVGTVREQPGNRSSHTVMGEAVNLGSRVEALNKFYGTNILITDSTHDAVDSRIRCREIDQLRINERYPALTLYEPLGTLPGAALPLPESKPPPPTTWPPATPQATDHLKVTTQQETVAATYEEALRLYRESDFDRAEKLWNEVLAIQPFDGPSKAMKRRLTDDREAFARTGRFEPVHDLSRATTPAETAKRAQPLRSLTGITIGRFVVGARLGSGGMGEVYLADDQKLGRRVALKRIAPELQADEQYRMRFFKEAERVSRFSSPRIAAIYDVVEEQGESLLVMEYVEGKTLRRRLAEPLGMASFLRIAIQCAEDLAAAHEKGIIHGDIKPENIMITTDGDVKLLDFGVAKRVPSPDDETLTMKSLPSVTIGISGTPAYMAPEVVLEKPPDHRADLFSLGIVFYESLAGSNPFRGDTLMGTFNRILHEESTPLIQLKPDVPAELDHTIGKMLAKDPADRYKSSSEVLTFLRGVQSYWRTIRSGGHES